MKTRKIINESFGLGELPSSKLIKMEMSLKDIMAEQDFTEVPVSKANHAVPDTSSTSMSGPDYYHPLDEIENHVSKLQEKLTEVGEFNSQVLGHLSDAVADLKAACDAIYGNADSIMNTSKQQLIAVTQQCVSECVRKRGNKYEVYDIHNRAKKIRNCNTKREAVNEIISQVMKK